MSGHRIGSVVEGLGGLDEGLDDGGGGIVDGHVLGRPATHLELDLALGHAAAAHHAQMEALTLLTPAVIEQARIDLRALAQAVGARQLPLREALLSQRTLIELLQAHLNAQRGLLLSRVELLRATGLLTESVPSSKGEIP